ncbi:GNAT family N-acetyltransferase [Streptomyces sp. NPDC102278]|uniref:GNAT family N-acetyltransferase n=1 Tax=Streptomyces sp. NPDC102278 TaxID=3366152 RepID=UPI0038259E35
MEELTCLLHRAYADHAAAGRIFFASYQSLLDTAHRLGKGECWVALRGNALVGTVTVAAPHAVPEGYPAPATAGSFWQLAVDPSERGGGLGQRLLGLAEERIAALGSAEAVIDTSAQATELVGWYRRRGERPPRFEMFVAAVAVGYAAGYTAGIGNEAEQVLGFVTVTALGWLWERWRR